MREILFRGKRVNDSEFVEGDLIKICGGTVIFHGSHEDSEIDSNSEFAIQFLPSEVSVVFPNTVNQYTGVTDKNETKVFENDKLLVHENVCGEYFDWTSKVAFKGGSFCLVNEDENPICSLFEVCGTFEVIPE